MKILQAMLIVYFPTIKGIEPIGPFPMPTVGTFHEIVVARQQKKTVFVVWESGKKHCSAWLMWLVKHQNVFGSFEELYQHLRDLRDGKLNTDNEWLVINPENNVV